MRIEIVTVLVLVVCNLCMLLLMGAVTWLSWKMRSAREVAEKNVLQSISSRLIGALWMVTVALIATIVFQEARSTSSGLPNLFSLGETASDYGKALVLLPLGAYLFVAQAIVGLTALTWRLPAFGGKRAGSDLSVPLLSASTFFASVLALGSLMLVSYLRLDAQGLL